MSATLLPKKSILSASVTDIRIQPHTECEDTQSIESFESQESFQEESFGEEDSGSHALRSLRKRFADISEDEAIINYFFCALRKGFLTHGTLYIGLECFYFVSKLRKDKIKYAEKWSNVISVEKENFLNLVPNSIKIVTTDSTYSFTSFTARNYPFHLIRFTIKNFEENLALTAKQIKEHAKNTCLIQFKEKYPNNILTSPNKILNMGSQILSSWSSQTSINSDSESFPDLRNHEGEVLEKQPKSNFRICSCQQLAHVLQNKVFKVDIDDIFNMLFDQNSIIMKNVLKKFNFKDYKCISTDVLDDGSKMKAFVSTLPSLMEGITGKVKIYQTFPSTNIPNKHYQVVTITQSESDQFGDSFKVVSRTCLCRCADNQTSYRVWMETNYTKQDESLSREHIEANNFKMFCEFHNEIANELSILFGPPVVIEQSEEFELTTKTEQVWRRKDWLIKNWHMFLHSALFVMLLSVFFKIIFQRRMINSLNSKLADCP